VLSGALSRGHGELERNHLYDIVERGGREALLRYTIVHFGRQKVLFGKRGEFGHQKERRTKALFI
jgi:hypothetical protein